MQSQELHPWRVSLTQAWALQQRLQHDVHIGTYVRDIRYVAGADVSVARFAPTVYAGVVVLDYVGMMRRTHAAEG